MSNNKTMDIQIAELINTAEPQNVLDEIRYIICSIYPDFYFEPLVHVFQDTVRIFRGEYPGYRECNTEYHNLKHTTDITLAVMRLIHGAILNGNSVSQRNIAMGIISALFHDIGFIQKSNDVWGTGAKYTLVHIQRGTEFMEEYLHENNYPSEDIEDCTDIIQCTDINHEIDPSKFRSEEIALLGKIIGSADLIGEMADRAYLEKLLFLYYEFREGKFGYFRDEIDLLKNTPRFYETAKKRLQEDLGGVNRFMIDHFRERWNIERDLYEDYIEKNINYLNYILTHHEKEYRNHLRRGGIVNKLNKKNLTTRN